MLCSAAAVAFSPRDFVSTADFFISSTTIKYFPISCSEFVMDPVRYQQLQAELQAESQAMQQRLHEEIYDQGRDALESLRDHYAARSDHTDAWYSKSIVKMLDIQLQLHPKRNAPEPMEEPETQVEPAPKRRKVRKGTQSCWQCKRRKTKCTFATRNAVICDGCRSRGTECVKQDVDEDDEILRRGAGEQRLVWSFLSCKTMAS